MKKRNMIGFIFLVVLFTFVLTYNNVDYNKVGFTKITGYFTGIDSTGNHLGNVCLDCNVILIIIDTLRADHVGAYGYERDTTPNIDKLAREGILFKNVVAQSSWTKPSTASILTGLYPKNHGANTREEKLAKDNIMLSELLKERGYDTHVFTANPTVSSATGFNQGYDTFLELVYPDDYSDTLNEKLLPFIGDLEKTSKQFIYVHYMDPHNPYLPREKHFSLSNPWDLDEDFFQEFFASSSTVSNEGAVAVNEMFINLYDDEILFNDKMVGDVIQALKDKEMYDNSIIVILSDHGEEFREHGSFLHGKTLLDEQLLVPWILWVPEGEHKEIRKQTSHIDVLPTILSLLDIQTPDDIDGINALRGEEQTYTYSELNYRGEVFTSIRSLEEKLIVGASLDSEMQNQYADMYKWFEHEAVLRVTGERIKIPIMSFYKSRPIQITMGDNELDGWKQEIVSSPIHGGGINLDLTKWGESGTAKTVTLTSTLPCRKVSNIGVNDDTRCISFGVADPDYAGNQREITEGGDGRFRIETSFEEGKNIFPAYAYFLLQDDPGEGTNLYIEREHQERILQLETKLEKYIKTGERRVSSEQVEYSDEQLEALKALGYI